MGEVYNASMNGLKNDFSSRLRNLQRSLDALKNQNSIFAKDHRKLRHVYNEIMEILENNE